MTEAYSDYISYDIQKYYRIKPEGPVRCIRCKCELSKSVIEPSKAMSEEIAGPDYDYGSSLLFFCNACHWWCVREHYEFVDGSCARRYGCDYLIFNTTNSMKAIAWGNMSVKYSQPWLKALEDVKVYDRDRLQSFPEELAVLFEGGMIWKEHK